jgi:CBS domain-containing protein
VSQVAVHSPHTTSAAASLAKVIATMRAFRLNAIAVIDGQALVGIVSSGDHTTLLEIILKSREDWPAAAR